ncbi:11696_t:CDS:10 [Dentiscutata heterogama]|uniref:11696_t:CDS:1 n=1 Tax=Dentiscutata heterogama TaxID=1316150 RepID=A0ACA9M2Y2_9GLOM|nr:11696_t:CDS:10 [Dentiscutata heterogama]
MDSKLNIDTGTITSSKKNDVLNQPDIVVISDTDEEPTLESTSNSFILGYEVLFALLCSLESEYNSASNLENNSVLMDDLEDNDASVNSLENKDEDYRYENKPINECFTVLPNSSTTSHCPHLHKTDTQVMKGKLVNKGPCPVKFYHVAPKDLTQCPFIAIISIGNEHDLSLTTRKLLTKPMLKIYLQGRPLSSLHPSLNNQSRLTYLIEKNKRSKYPFGQDIIGVAHELLKQKKLPDPYIRSVRFLDDGQYLVLCARKEQAELLSQSSYIEIDMAFKRIHGVTNEWEVCAYVHRYQKVLVFARIFTNFQSARAYQYLFEDLFDTVEKDMEKPFEFQHIHGRRLGCIIADEHQGQALGLGKYLHSKYSYLSCEEHLKHIYKLCQVHFNHNIRNKAISDETKKLMYSVTKLNTQEEILNVLEKIKKSDEPGTAEWVNDKYKPWILAGLSSAFTKMKADIWNQTPNNTNASESAHANINHDGRSLSLLAAIYRHRPLTLMCAIKLLFNLDGDKKLSTTPGNDFNQYQWNSAKTYEKYNVHESYRDKSELGRLTNNSKRTPKNKEPISRSISQKKRKNQALNGGKSEDLSLSSTSTLTMVPTTQEQDNYIEWENKKLELRQKNLEILKEEISLREKLNNLKQS